MVKSKFNNLRKVVILPFALTLLSACSAHAGTPVSDVDIILEKVPGGAFFSASQDTISCFDREVAGPGLPPPIPVPSTLARTREPPIARRDRSSQECDADGDAIAAVRNAIDRLTETRSPGSCCDEQILARQLRELQSALETETNLMTEVIRTVAAAAEVLESNQNQPDLPQLTARNMADCLSGLQTYLQLQEVQEAKAAP